MLWTGNDERIQHETPVITSPNFPCSSFRLFRAADSKWCPATPRRSSHPHNATGHSNGDVNNLTRHQVINSSSPCPTPAWSQPSPRLQQLVRQAYSFTQLQRPITPEPFELGAPNFGRILLSPSGRPQQSKSSRFGDNQLVDADPSTTASRRPQSTTSEPSILKTSGFQHRKALACPKTTEGISTHQLISFHASEEPRFPFMYSESSGLLQRPGRTPGIDGS